MRLVFAMKSMTSTDEKWMQIAIQQAKNAANQGEVPVGAALVLDHKLLAAAGNSPISSSDPTAHAEISTIREAAGKERNYRLINTTLYVTLEPCIMCMGAIIHARISRLVFGAYDPKTGAVVSCFKFGSETPLNHSIEYMGGVLEKDCSLLLKSFFAKKRRIKRRTLQT